MVPDNKSNNVWKVIIIGIIIVLAVIAISKFINYLIPMLGKYAEIDYWFKLFGIIFLALASIASFSLLIIGILIAFKLIESSDLKVNFLFKLLWSIPVGVLLLIFSKYLP